MALFAGSNIIVLDVETAYSADELATGWLVKTALGLSIGCFYDYQDGMCHWFDVHTLEEIMTTFVERQPMMVSFNGIGFDFALMCVLLRQKGEHVVDWYRIQLTKLCERFEALAETSYDILAEIWRANSKGKYEKGLNSLDAILEANKLPRKTGTGELAPKLWQEGRIAEVLNYCQNDVQQTKALFELLPTQHGLLQRKNGPLAIRYVDCDLDGTPTIIDPCTF